MTLLDEPAQGELALGEPAPPELQLAARLADLHQLLYVRGGIKPINAAVEEMAKLLLLRIASHRLPDLEIDGYGKLSSLLPPEEGCELE